MMKRPILHILLGCSIVFNVFFIFGAMQWRPLDEQRPGHADIINRVVDTMNLDEEQRTAFKAMRDDFEAETAVISGQVNELETAIAALLASDNPDLEQVDVLVQQKMALRNERRRAGSERFEVFLAMLNPEQRHELGRRMERHRPERRHDDHQRVLKRFDQNGNGTLDPEEQLEADAFLEERRNERERPIDGSLFNRFDIDEDGFLSPDEASALGIFLRSDRPRRGGPSSRGPQGPRGPRPRGSGEGEPEPDAP